MHTWIDAQGMPVHICTEIGSDSPERIQDVGQGAANLKSEYQSLEGRRGGPGRGWGGLGGSYTTTTMMRRT